jgi:hypothetical protein
MTALFDKLIGRKRNAGGVVLAGLNPLKSGLETLKRLWRYCVSSAITRI